MEDVFKKMPDSEMWINVVKVKHKYSKFVHPKGTCMVYEGERNDYVPTI